MNKEILSQTDIYFGEINMPKHFDINRDQLKSSLLESVLKDQQFFNDFVDRNFNDFKLNDCPAFFSLNTYFIESMFLKHKLAIRNNFKFGSLFAKNQSSLTKNTVNKMNLLNSPDYTFIYGVDVSKNSQDLVILYNDKRAHNLCNVRNLNNNQFIMFPSFLKYYFSPNESENINTYLVTTYNLLV
tara:strand:+ start:765 stop:1319 length:555 start_codon:yes stop_codon:yes gene_type:complete